MKPRFKVWNGGSIPSDVMYKNDGKICVYRVEVYLMSWFGCGEYEAVVGHPFVFDWSGYRNAQPSRVVAYRLLDGPYCESEL